MADELVFYTHPMSRGRIVRWMLEETGAPYRTELLKYGETMKEGPYLGVNPMGKVPAIRHGDVVVTECAAICAYLADAFPEAKLAPAPTSPMRGPYYRWMFFAAGPIEAATTNKSLGVAIPAEKKRMVGYGDFADMEAALGLAITPGPYVCGDQFTAADVYFGSQMNWGMRFGSLTKQPAIEAYVERLTSRPAYQRATEIDDKLMAEAA